MVAGGGGGLDADDGGRFGRLSREDGDGPGRRLPGPRPRLLRLPGRDAPGVGRGRRRASRPSRAGHPSLHDHVLVANVVEMLDAEGGWKAADTTLWREHLHAATIVGRAASARVAVELGYAITPDHGPSGRLGHWRIAGIPDEVLEIHSKRAAEITDAVEARGTASYRARHIAARDTTPVKRHTPLRE